ncbi:hypothetical protein [Ochrobactrum sp. 3-3]|uniref:hypothetical protein n=1 Tax=Ochrobactrum sp. 3-3 TaxID=1830124 RepID=UPI000DEF1E8E|nr:hypothetical protein [Ochrobactrum sp. 3-3]
MNVFYDIEKSVAELRAHMATIEVDENDSSAPIQLRTIDIHEQFLRWMLGELNRDSDIKDVIFSLSSLIANFIKCIDESFGPDAKLLLMALIAKSLDGEIKHVGGRLHIDEMKGGRA